MVELYWNFLNDIRRYDKKEPCKPCLDIAPITAALQVNFF